MELLLLVEDLYMSLLSKIFQNIAGIAFIFKQNRIKPKKLYSIISGIWILLIADVTMGITQNVKVSATAGFQTTGIDVHLGNSVSIEALGVWRWGGADPPCSANGAKYRCSPPCCMYTAICPTAKCGQLIGRVGSAGTCIPLGTSVDFAATSAGELYLFV